MAIDTPARLAILGAGPLGLEAALYARFLGYDLVIFERGEVAEAVRQRGDEMLPAPFAGCRSTLGLAAIEAQDDKYQPPADDAALTAGQWRDRYLLPLAQTDLLADHLRLHTTVTTAHLADDGWWYIHSRDANGQEQSEPFDGVLDCSGPESGLPQQPAADYYHVLGAKSAAAASADFGFTDGLDQIRRAFAILGDRESLDLYAGARRLLR